MKYNMYEKVFPQQPNAEVDFTMKHILAAIFWCIVSLVTPFPKHPYKLILYVPFS